MTLSATRQLLDIMRTLRDPVHGCPWDQEQTFASIVPHTLEEAYELAEAIERQDADGIQDELGDLLFQVVFYAELGRERNWFDFDSLAARLCDKLKRRHPHVFASGRVGTDDTGHGQWERIKTEERRQAAVDGTEPGALAGVARNLPALTRAWKLQRRAARVGFDWNEVTPVLAKIEEELQEFRRELQSDCEHDRLQEEFGDFMFACVNLARHAGIDPETALRRANRKFETRFGYIESCLADDDRKPEDSNLEEMDELWERAKDNGL